MIMVKNGIFFRFLFLCKNDLEIMFRYLLVGKESFRAYKKCTSDSRIFPFFPNGLTHGYGIKKGIFSVSFFAKK